jgi:hypothetical protein
LRRSAESPLRRKSVGEAMAIGRTFKEGEHTRPACWFRRPRRNHLPRSPDSVSGALTDAREGACAPLRSLETRRPCAQHPQRPGRRRQTRAHGTEVKGCLRSKNLFADEFLQCAGRRDF